MKEQKHLLPPVERYYKAQLHCHTTMTDGDWTPEELKQAYMEKGYSIVAYTDHGLMTCHPELDDKNFLALTSYEMDILEPVQPKAYARMYHLNVIMPDRYYLWQAYQPKIVFDGVSHMMELVRFGNGTQEYSVENINRLIAASNEHGGLVTYNHPSGSNQDVDEYGALEGLWGVEVYNHDCWLHGYDESNHRLYRDFLKQGKRVVPIAADDGHDWGKMDGGWTMIGAEKLEYGAVFSALKAGNFYSSTGPDIYSLTLSDNELSIACSGAVRISVHTNFRMAMAKCRKAGEPLVTETVFDLSRWKNLCTEDYIHEAWFYLTVEDDAGHTAWTRAYWYDELFPENK